MSEVSKSVIVEAAATAGEKFVEMYYKAYDTQRHFLLKFYRETSQVMWEGNPVSGGLAGISTFFAELPSTKHQCLAFDCQPAVATTGLANTLLVSVSGTVSHADERPRQFGQTLILVPDEKGVHYVQCDVFRFC